MAFNVKIWNGSWKSIESIMTLLIQNVCWRGTGLIMSDNNNNDVNPNDLMLFQQVQTLKNDGLIFLHHRKHHSANDIVQRIIYKMNLTNQDVVDLKKSDIHQMEKTNDNNSIEELDGIQREDSIVQFRPVYWVILHDEEIVKRNRGNNDNSKCNKSVYCKQNGCKLLLFHYNGNAKDEDSNSNQRFNNNNDNNNNDNNNILNAMLQLKYENLIRNLDDWWNTNNSTTSNTLDFLWLPSIQQVHQLFVWISFINHSFCDLNIEDRCVLQTECGWRVSESFFSFYIDYPSQK